MEDEIIIYDKDSKLSTEIQHKTVGETIEFGSEAIIDFSSDELEGIKDIRVIVLPETQNLLQFAKEHSVNIDRFSNSGVPIISNIIVTVVDTANRHFNSGYIIKLMRDNPDMKSEIKIGNFTIAELDLTYKGGNISGVKITPKHH